MPNVTPEKYRLSYQLYPGKPSVDERPEESVAAALRRIAAAGRPIGTGFGNSPVR